MNLEQDGIAMLGQILSKQVQDICDYLMDKPLYLGGHVLRCCEAGSVPTKDFLDNPKPYYSNSLGCYDFPTIVATPWLISTALEFADLAQSYLRQEPVIYSANIWWSFPGGPTMPDVQGWHRDMDDRKFLALYFYLTDVDADAAHIYRKSSSHQNNVADIPENTVSVLGPAGTIFIENGYGYHKGTHPTERPRLAAWVRYGVSDRPKSYKTDRLFPVANRSLYQTMSGKERRMTRLIVKDV